MTFRRQQYLPQFVVKTEPDTEGISWRKSDLFLVRNFLRSRKRKFVFTLLVLVLVFFFGCKMWHLLPFAPNPPTLVYRREDLQRIWLWELESGNYPSSISIPQQIGLKITRNNTSRLYPELPENFTSFPPRPEPGSICDLDIVMQHCNFSTHKFVRDCLEVLRVGAGLDNDNRLRRENLNDWKYIYIEKSPENRTGAQVSTTRNADSLAKKTGAELEPSLLSLPPTKSPRVHSAACDPDYPRLFHMFWAGPFTDKPYMTLLSFLYTQRLHLHESSRAGTCTPLFLVWINPGPAASIPNPNATSDMFKDLGSNPWASPFLHERFKDVIHFKLWNTTEQLDELDELRHDWRKLPTLFNSGGHLVDVPSEDRGRVTSHTDVLHRIGSKSSSTYDRLSVTLSDMVRFILCHRFGGIYLDADTILLRDWEELWGWKGAFAYRWSRLTRYNTAVLRMNKGSAIGTFLFRTALKNSLDFHPMTVSRYLQDAHLDGLLLQLPDALFDPAWLNTENYQRDRPPQPYFKAFEDFFDTPAVSTAAPIALGLDGFFKGAFSYHYHNFWWKPFDPSRNWPDLGPRFSSSEEIARKNAGQPAENTERGDLSWSSVTKRTFESYMREERPNMYGEWLQW